MRLGKIDRESKEEGGKDRQGCAGREVAEDE